MIYIYFRELVKELQQNVAGLNSEFDRNHQTVTAEIQNLKNVREHNRTVSCLVGAKERTKPMIDCLGKISNTMKKLNKIKKDHVDNTYIMRIDKTLKLHQELIKKIDDLVQNSDTNRINRKSVEYNNDVRKITAEFLKTLKEIKDAKDIVKKKLLKIC